MAGQVVEHAADGEPKVCGSVCAECKVGLQGLYKLGVVAEVQTAHVIPEFKRVVVDGD